MRPEIRIPQRILCVCLGNICRSPTAEAVLRQQIEQVGWSITVDSAGTSNYHPNKAPDSRSQRYAAARGLDLSGLRARQVALADFYQFDLILAMDHNNYADLQQMQSMAVQQYAGRAPRAQLALMSEHDAIWPQQAVPDPYYGAAQDFERVLDQCFSAAEGWVKFWRSSDHTASATVIRGQACD
ncbi:MAG: low molecular weight protein-tyrosine-phosphatase [Pseudomonadota bacterium]|nr:low molecular weight protein-tyrosine-phosphatase [Pseudomonadota bacterium]